MWRFSPACDIVAPAGDVKQRKKVFFLKPGEYTGEKIQIRAGEGGALMHYVDRLSRFIKPIIIISRYTL
jgi:hypothetical protein